MIDLKEIVDSLLSISPWPWRDHLTDEYAVIDEHGCAVSAPFFHVDDKNFIASSPVWLATVIVGWMEERAWHYDQSVVFHREGMPTETAMTAALRDFNLDPEKFAELKRRLENSPQNGQRNVL